ncbi:hypothetical protein [Mumia zhuanghuii]|nr:hypothetical protein [Mumia zhuanghuii]
MLGLLHLHCALKLAREELFVQLVVRRVYRRSDRRDRLFWLDASVL